MAQNTAVMPITITIRMLKTDVTSPWISPKPLEIALVYADKNLSMMLKSAAAIVVALSLEAHALVGIALCISQFPLELVSPIRLSIFILRCGAFPSYHCFVAALFRD